MMKSTESKVAIVTGASRGIGRATARALSARGMHVLINYHQNAQMAEELASKLASALPYQADVRDEAQVKAMVSYTVEHFGTVDVLVNCAGINADTLSARMSAESWNKVLDTNLTGTFYCCKAVQRYMLRSRWGRIVSLGSIVGLAGNAGQANYAAAKAGLVGLTKTLAKELGAAGITANVVAPGMIETDMLDSLSEEQRSQYLERIPIGRYGTVDEVANLVSFLCSKEASYITGQVIGIDGGIQL